MKIGITCHTSAGGSGIVATELGVSLAERGHEIHFVTNEPPFRLQGFHDSIVCHSVDMVNYPLFRFPPVTLALASRIAEVAEQHNIEIWHAHYAIPHAMCAIMARDMLPPEKRFKIVTTLHGTDITLVGSDPSFFRATQHAMEKSDAVTAVSHWLSAETKREFKLERPIQTIHNFLQLERFPEDAPNRCKLALPDEKIVMHISNFRPVKRVTDVVRAFRKIVDRVNARLVMVGDGPERMSAMGVAKQLGVADRIKLVGNQEAIENILPCADLVFQPSEHESFGLVHLEAMACEIPVIGTDSGGVREVVVNGETGYLCEVGDTETMAQHAIEILTDADLASALGRAGRKRARERFAEDAIVGEYEQLYRDLVAVPMAAAK
jgi:N-acetyl-alpha-D-glucosaminyl L-malate synthase BshA